MIKYKSDGSVEREKAPLVTKGYTQRGLDFLNYYAMLVS